MEERGRYRQKLHRRFLGCLAGILACLAALKILSWTGEDYYRALQEAGLLYGIRSGVETVLLALAILAVKVGNALQDEKKCRELEIREKDERSRAIWDQSLRTAAWLLLALGLAAPPGPGLRGPGGLQGAPGRDAGRGGGSGAVLALLPEEDVRGGAFYA